MDNNDSFQIKSSYENFNLISQNKLIINKLLQKKMKDYLLEQIENSNNSLIPKKMLSYKSLDNKKTRCSNKKNSENTDFRKSNFFINDNLGGTMKTANKSDNRDSENNITPIQKKKKTIINRLSLSQINMENVMKKALSGKDLFEPNLKSDINTNNDNNCINQSIIDIQKSEKSANPIITSPNLKSRKRKGTVLLNKININIQKRNQILNNPDIFYTNYFNSIIIGELNQKLNNKKDKSFSPKKLRSAKEKEKIKSIHK